ncbi:unnamed protein product [[Candida] boidinii]|nr:unnamed protein product [[Candida] boidinii]
MNEPKFNGQNHQDVLTKAIRGITIKQVIFSCDSQEYQKKLEPSRATTLDDVKKTQVRAILLWECLKVDRQEDAFTTFRRIHLPTNLEEQYQRQQRNLLEQTSQEQTKALKDHNAAMLENMNKQMMTSSPLATKSEEFKQPMNLNFFQKKPVGFLPQQQQQHLQQLQQQLQQQLHLQQSQQQLQPNPHLLQPPQPVDGMMMGPIPGTFNVMPTQQFGTLVDNNNNIMANSATRNASYYSDISDVTELLAQME